MANRRDFLKQTAAAAAALYWFPELVAASQSTVGNGSGAVVMGAFPVTLSAHSALANDYGSVEITVSSPFTKFRLTRVPGPTYYAVDEICTHQGCNIGAYISSSHYFRCPCHSAKFYADGSVFSGPTSKPLKSYAVTVVDSDTINVDIPGYAGVSPVEIASYGGAFVTDHVALSWTTASEIDNAGFLIDRRVRGDESWELLTATMLPGAGSSAVEHHYGFTDHDVLRGRTYEYRLRQIDRDGTENAVREVAVVIPIGGFTLSQNFPDPFSSSTQWTYSLTHDDHVTIAISEMNGMAMCTLVDAELPAREYSLVWDGRDKHGNAVPSGTYIITMRTSGGVLSRTVQKAR